MCGEANPKNRIILEKRAKRIFERIIQIFFGVLSSSHNLNKREVKINERYENKYEMSEANLYHVKTRYLDVSENITLSLRDKFSM